MKKPQALSVNVSGQELEWAFMKKPQALSVNVHEWVGIRVGVHEEAPGPVGECA